MFTVLDLCSGIGGFAIATERAGGRTLAFSENAPYPSKILAKHWPDTPNLGDLRKICRRVHHNLSAGQQYDPDYLECSICHEEFGDCACIGTDQFTDTYGHPDVVVGGIPCQPASGVGRRRGTADERWLWPDAVRIVGELEPTYGVFENPEALLTLEDGEAFRGILRSFAEIGYDAQGDVVPASSVGAGHRRARLWLLVTHSDSARLERHARHGEISRQTQPKGHDAPRRVLPRKITSEVWYHQSPVRPVVDGLPAGLVREQLTAVGNSLVPDVAEIYMRAIALQYLV